MFCSSIERRMTKQYKKIMKTFYQNKHGQINEEGVIHYSTSKKFIVRIKKNNLFKSLKAFDKEQDAIDFYNNWLLENR